MSTYDFLETLDGPTRDELEAIEAEASELVSVWYEFGDES